ncbi:hypothetical protein PUN28_012980 [Cardiocondyla obscurior]|uniref:Uncharacterized protein n=1 Tax=Cardiocondyla obscurior TaxID=286306 RepID=A0AAW2F6D2_9HYME
MRPRRSGIVCLHRVGGLWERSFRIFVTKKRKKKLNNCKIDKSASKLPSCECGLIRPRTRPCTVSAATPFTRGAGLHLTSRKCTVSTCARAYARTCTHTRAFSPCVFPAAAPPALPLNVCVTVCKNDTISTCR